MTNGDQGLRLRAEATVTVLRDLVAEVTRLQQEHRALKAEHGILDHVMGAIGHVLCDEPVSDFDESYAEVRGVLDLKRAKERAEAALRDAQAPLKELEDWCADPDRDTFRHRYKDDGVIYTPYRVMAARVKALRASDVLRSGGGQEPQP